MASLPKQSTECLILSTLNINAPTFMASRDHDRGGEHAAALTVLLVARLARARCRAVRDSTLVTWYRSVYAPRTGGAYDSHHRTSGIAGCTRRRGCSRHKDETVAEVLRRTSCREAFFSCSVWPLRCAIPSARG